jgi:hypothetical protein
VVEILSFLETPASPTFSLVVHVFIIHVFLIPAPQTTLLWKFLACIQRIMQLLQKYMCRISALLTTFFAPCCLQSLPLICHLLPHERQQCGMLVEQSLERLARRRRYLAFMRGIIGKCEIMSSPLPWQLELQPASRKGADAWTTWVCR